MVRELTFSLHWGGLSVLQVVEELLHLGQTGRRDEFTLLHHFLGQSSHISTRRETFHTDTGGRDRGQKRRATDKGLLTFHSFQQVSKSVGKVSEM